MLNYKKYRWFFTSSNKLVIGGKSAEQNDYLLNILKEGNEDCIVMHTSSPGSPFSVIISEIDEITKEDIKECAIFTACFSRAWKEKKKKVYVDIFKISQLHKESEMKEGTWGVTGKVDRISSPLELCLIKQKGVLRAVPFAPKSTVIIKLSPGNIDKKDISAKLELELDKTFDEEELLSALPSGGFKVKK